MHTSDIIGVGLDLVVLDRLSPRTGADGLDFITDEERLSAGLVKLALLSNSGVCGSAEASWISLGHD